MSEHPKLPDIVERLRAKADDIAHQVRGQDPGDWKEIGLMREAASEIERLRCYAPAEDGEEVERMATAIAMAEGHDEWTGLPNTEADALKSVRDGGTAFCKDDYRRLARAGLSSLGRKAEGIIRGDGCTVPGCQRKNVPGNENVIDGRLVCDDCHAAMRSPAPAEDGLREALEEAAATLDRISLGIQEPPPELRQFPYGLMKYTAAWLRSRVALSSGRDGEPT